jgi:hypothetical protein
MAPRRRGVVGSGHGRREPRRGGPGAAPRDAPPPRPASTPAPAGAGRTPGPAGPLAVPGLSRSWPGAVVLPLSAAGPRAPSRLPSLRSAASARAPLLARCCPDRGHPRRARLPGTGRCGDRGRQGRRCTRGLATARGPARASGPARPAGGRCRDVGTDRGGATPASRSGPRRAAGTDGGRGARPAAGGHAPRAARRGRPRRLPRSAAPPGYRAPARRRRAHDGRHRGPCGDGAVRGRRRPSASGGAGAGRAPPTRRPPPERTTCSRRPFVGGAVRVTRCAADRGIRVTVSDRVLASVGHGRGRRFPASPTALAGAPRQHTSRWTCAAQRCGAHRRTRQGA